MTDAELFMNALGAPMSDEERIIICGFVGDPHDVGPAAWRPRPWKLGKEFPIDFTANGYTTVACFKKASDGTYRRRSETFSRGLALMIDDVGTKVDASILGLPPSARIETSPNNEQWWYFLSEPEPDAARFDGVIRAFIHGKLLGADPGMSGITRVGRVPGFQNSKKAYGGWTVKLNEINNLRYTIEELLRGFGLSIMGRREPRVKLHSEEAIERNRSFMTAYKFLDQRNMLKRAEPDPSGWTEMRCPWVEDHTGSSDTGAAIREPAAENDYYGAFRCHHGHCNDKGLGDVTDWINDLSIEELDNANRD